MVLISEIQKSVETQNEISDHDKLATVQRSGFTNLDFSNSHIEIISGIRRCGKSTLMQQIQKKLGGNCVRFNFEDPRIYNFTVEDFSKLDSVIGSKTDIYFFDEIQNIDAWEVYVRQLHDRGKKVFITGSNASLLSKELGTRLTGRYLRHELMPFNYQEYLLLKNTTNSVDQLNNYIGQGGFPEFLKSGNIEMLQNLLKDILFRDIAIRYGLKNTTNLTQIALYLISNVGKEFSFNGLKNSFAIGSATTVSDYLGWMEDSYLFFYLKKFDWSAKKILVNPRKVYCIDSGFAIANSLSFSEDKGRLLENCMFLYLHQNFEEIFYFKEKKECDFVVFNKNKIQHAIQVCEEIHLDNQAREIEGLLEAMKFFDLNEGLIITKNQNDELVQNGKKIHLVSIDKILLVGINLNN